MLLRVIDQQLSVCERNALVINEMGRTLCGQFQVSLKKEAEMTFFGCTNDVSSRVISVYAF